MTEHTSSKDLKLWNERMSEWTSEAVAWAGFWDNGAMVQWWISWDGMMKVEIVERDMDLIGDATEHMNAY